MKIHLLIPMSGQGTRYREAGYTEPKPLIPVNGRPMISRLLRSFPESWPTHFVMADNHQETKLPSVVQQLRPKSKLHFIPKHTLGPSFAVLKALEQIPDSEAVLVSYCDYGMIWDSSHFEDFVETTQCDACVISYRGFHAHYLSPVKYAYCRLEGERVVEVKEKGWFTDNRENEFCSAGAYYFKSAKLLREAILFQQQNELSLSGEFYTSLTVEAVLRSNPQAQVRVFEIPYFFQWGTPDDLRAFEYWEKTFQAYHNNSREKVAQVMMPMAGLGSRFSHITDTPKPFIPIHGTPMYQAALELLPQAEKTALVSLNSVREKWLKDPKEKKVIWLEKTPDGQALSTEKGLDALVAEQEVLVSACDHGAILAPETLNKLRACESDAAIFTIQGYPGANRRPTAYAYVVPKEGTPFSEVASVSVKVPLSANPSQDPLLVGTFWFRSGQILAEGIALLKKKNIRVNGELYLDSIFGILKERGYRVHQVPLAGYLCWGDPDSLAEALYWQEVFCGYRIQKRERFPGISSEIKNGT